MVFTLHLNKNEKKDTALWLFSKVRVGNCKSLLVSLISTCKQLTFENRYSNIWKRPWQRRRFNDQTFAETLIFVPNLGAKRSINLCFIVDFSGKDANCNTEHYKRRF